MEGVDQKDQAQKEIENWGYDIPERRHQLLREHLGRIEGYDLQEVLIGHIIERIIGDDEGAFGIGLICFDPMINKPQEAPREKDKLFKRIDWEMEQQELPGEISRLLSETRKNLEPIAWDSKRSVIQAQAVWAKGVGNKVDKMVEDNLDGIGDAHQAYRAFIEELQRRKLEY